MNQETTIETPQREAVVLHELVRLCEVDPKKNPAFSPNLHRWLRKNRTMRRFADRYECEGIEYLGYLDDGGFLIGSKLWGVLCNGGAETVWAYPRFGNVAIHKPLWNDYRERGRCAIDPTHEQYSIDDRFAVSGESRKCLWCGHDQRRETYEVKQTRERWVSEPNSPSHQPEGSDAQ